MSISSRVTRFVCEKIAQNVAKPFFVKIKTMEKVVQKILATSANFF
jgi:hypothetical protein